MINTGKLAGRTLFITGASRGIGKAIALKAARDGANIVIAAKTAQPHSKLPGTIYTAAEEIESVGGKALPCVVDVRDENSVRKAIDEAVKKFGGIDIVVNNASAISLTGTAETDMKRYDLMHNINTRGTFLVSKECLPYLKKSNHAHILNLSPPLNMSPIWFSRHVAYTMAKYGMSMCVLGMAEEFKPYNISVNALWPRTAITTAAMDMIAGKESADHSRKPEIVSDAAYAILIQDPKSTTGNFYIDDEVLTKCGVTDLDQYLVNPENKNNLIYDFFIKEGEEMIMGEKSTPVEIKTSNKNVSKTEGLLKKMYANFSPELADKIDALYQFNLTGKEAGTWYLELRRGKKLAYGSGNAPTKPDATMTIDSEDLYNMLTGKLNGATAYMSGKLKISGNLQKSMKLQKLTDTLKSKI